MSWKVMSARKFPEWAAKWQALNDRGEKTALLDVRFIAPLLEAFGTGRELLAVKGDPDAPSAMAILQSMGFGRFETFQPSQAPLGAWVSDAANAPSEAVLAGLLRRLPGVAVSCGITQIDPEFFARPATTSRLQTLDYIRTAHVPVTGTFEEYWGARGQNLKKNHRRRRHRLADSGIAPRLERVTEAAAMAKAVAEYGALESKGWKAGSGTAVAADNAQGRFYTRMLEAFAATGEAVVYRYWYGDRLAASDLCIIRDGVLIILKTTYDEDLAETSPAMLMREEEFAEIFRSGTVRRIEFYGKVMDWHTKWTAESRVMYHVTAFRWAFAPRLLAHFKKAKAEQATTPVAEAPLQKEG
ncbi:MAG TPA: GNAT family N-acetyltransferase [Planctomycetota bacterium]|nr:GNAT family N-acetyltransferase [Planctomycetota bacterium]